MISEAEWEVFTLETLADLFWRPKTGAEIAPGTGERESWDDVVIPSRFRQSLRKLNPSVPATYLDQAAATILAPESQDDIAENYRIHRYLTEGFRGLTYIDSDGREQTPTIRLVSAEPADNDWLAVNQVTVIGGERERRFDVVLYLNGLPVAIIELKRAGSASADVASAHAQLCTYVREFPLAFRCAVLTLATDGLEAKYGTPFTPLNHFTPWNVDENGAPIKREELPSRSTFLDIALHGLFHQFRFLTLLRDYVAFDDAQDAGLLKRIAKPHQYFAVSKALEKTVTAIGSSGKAGVVWHTQGSGKSMEMELYANQVSRHPRLKNPTIVVVTDRNELDGQLYRGFARSKLLPEAPKQIKRREELRAELSGRVSGGIYFTTLQKFSPSQVERESGAGHPLLTDRSNVVVIVDEAHRSHYDDLDGYARHLRDALPHATLIAFTGTPISTAERNTQDVFGDYIDIYDLTRAVNDGATVPVYFESRLVKVQLADDVTQEDIDRTAGEATAGLDDTERARIEQSVAVVNAIYGAPARLEKLAADLVAHWEDRRAAMTKVLGTEQHPVTPGKGLVVGATRDICARLYDAIVALRPEWHSDELAKGRIKVVYSGDATDQPPISNHVRRPSENETIKSRLRNPADELELVIVKDMMLTGFDAPALHTLYLDRPLKGALLMQTLARVNRTFRGKQDGLLVGYAPVVENLKAALEEYTTDDRANRPVGRDVGKAVEVVHESVNQIRELLSGYDWRSRLLSGGPRAMLDAVTSTVEYVRSTHTPGNRVPDGEETLAAAFRRLTSVLARAWAIAGRQDELQDLHNEVRFYEEVRVYMGKYDAADRHASGQPIPDDVQRLLHQLVSDAVVTGEVLDIYEAAGMERPSLDNLSPEFVERAKSAEHPHLAIEALRSLVMQEARTATRTNVVRQRAFSERIVELMNRYTNSQLTAAEVIAELIEVAKETVAENQRGETFDPPLSTETLSFYDAVAANESARDVLGDEVLADIARELVDAVRRDAKTDWTVREDVKAKLRTSVKRLLAKHKYPPDKQPEAIKLVMEQAESMAVRLAA